MSTQNRNQARIKGPVSSHPLFPAIVALWFGALFGLGSLAVRASLIESMVISSHLDVIFPMAAPPLGMTARILLSLAMAVIGIAAGAAIARRIARPKPVERQRRRSANVVEAKATERPTSSTGNKHMRREAQPQAEPAASGPSRRRALSVEQEERGDSRLEAAPLPGGPPEIFDVTQIDMTTPQAAATEPEVPVDAVQPLELGGFAEPEQPFVGVAAGNPAAQPAPVDCLVLDEPAEAPQDRQVFGRPQQSSGSVLDGGIMADAPVMTTEMAEHAVEPAQSRPFDAAPAAFEAAPEPALPNQSFAPPQSFVPQLPEQAEVPTSDDHAMTENEPQIELRRFDTPVQSGPEPLPEIQPLQTVAFSEPAAAQAAAAPRVDPGLPKSGATDRIAAANLAELSPVELIERFALALQQRRHSGATPTGLAEAAASFAPQAPAQVPESFVPPAISAAFAAPAPIAAPEPQAEQQLPPIPTGFGEAAAGTAPAAAQPSPLTLPAALRPINFSDYADHDDDHGHVPPRSIGIPAPAAAQSIQPEPPSIPAVAATAAERVNPLASAEAASEVEAVEAEADVLEAGYSSLLDLNRPAPLRQTFVRIEEPVAESAPVEPVVVFPGQDARAGTQFARPAQDAPQTVPQSEPAPSAPESSVATLRRFDAPGTTGPVAGANVAGAQDPAEAERALRSALATLQRMSGAA